MVRCAGRCRAAQIGVLVCRLLEGPFLLLLCYSCENSQLYGEKQSASGAVLLECQDVPSQILSWLVGCFGNVFPNC